MGEEINCQHKDLASGRWNEMSLPVQMANIGSEVSRALNWQKKDNQEYCLRAASRSIDLLDLSLSSPHSFSKIKELARLREALDTRA